jgi:diadenylate cyclase
MGITEESDAIALVVSEETGSISIGIEGKLERNLEEDELRERLGELLLNASGDDEEGDETEEDEDQDA